MRIKSLTKKINKIITLNVISLLVLYPFIKLTATPAQAAPDQAVNWQAYEDIMVVEGQRNQLFRDHISAGLSYAQLGRSASLIKFNTTSLPSNAVITSATLNVRQYSETTIDVGHNVYASRITNSWIDDTAVWGSVGYDMNTSSKYVAPGIQNVTLDVTSIVQSWQTGSPNYGIALRSPNTGSGGSYCSVRQPYTSEANGGSEIVCERGNYKSWIRVNYTLNDAPLEPVVVKPNSGSLFGGRPYVADGKNCTENNGCDVFIQFDNIGDPNVGTPGAYEETTIYVEAQGVGETISNTFRQDRSTAGSITWNPRVKDGNYKVYAVSKDKMGETTPSNIAEFKVDSTPPPVPTIIEEPEFTGRSFPGQSWNPVEKTQNLVKANPVSDTNNLSNPVQYQFCRADDELFAVNKHCSGWVDIAEFGFGDLDNEKKYYYRVQARDSANIDLTNPDTGNISTFSGITSSIQDWAKPVVSNAKINGKDDGDRISPLQIDNVKDSADFTFTVTEKYFDKAYYEIINSQTGAILRKTNNLATCTPDTTNTIYTCVVKFDGKNDAGGLIQDGGYKVKLVGADKAGNEDFNDNLVVVIDNTPGAISISSPKDKAFINTPNIDLKGQVVSQDDVKLYVKNILFNNGEEKQIESKCIDISSGLDCTPETKDDQRADSYFFDKNFLLNLGENSFTLRSDDSVSNQEIKTITITREEEKPLITNIKVDNLEPSLTKNRKPLISFDLSDPNTQGHGQAGINKDSVNLSLINAKNEELILVTNSQNQSSLGNVVNTCADLTNTTGSLNCSFKYVFDSELVPDSIYKIKINVKDKAENSTSDETKAFNLDSNIYQNITSPTTGNVFARKNIEFTGKGEKGALLKIKNNELGKETSIILDDSNNNTGKDNDFVVSNFTISCNETLDFDNSVYTGENGANLICNWKVTLQQNSDNTVYKELTNTNIFTLADTAGNTKTDTIVTKVNLFALDIKFTPDLSYISADGNGKQDGINYAASIQNPSNPNDQPLVQSWYYKVFKIEANTKVLVRTITGENSLPQNLYFDGRQDNGEWLLDGPYEYEVKVATLDNPNLPLIKGTFTNITKFTQGVFITYPSGTSPSNPFITSNGVTNVQGQASSPTGTPTSVRYEDISVKICIDTIGLDTSCDFEYTTEVDQNGFFGRVVPLVRLSNNTDHVIQARLVDKFGNESSLSNKVYVRVSVLDPFVDVKVVPVYSGINKDEQLKNLRTLVEQYEKATSDQQRAEIAGKILTETNNLRKVILRSTVTKDTSYVKFSYADLTNAVEINGNELKKDIGWIDNKDFEYSRNVLGPINYDQGGAPLTEKCASLECTWDFDYVVPNLSGGIYDINFTGRKGQVERTLSAALIIDANILAKPLIIDLNKINGTDVENAKVFSNKYYSNKKLIQLKGVSTPGANITIKDSISGAVICTTKTTDIGIFVCNNVELPVGANLEQEFSLQAIASKGPQTETSEADTLLRYDEKAPEVVSYRNINSNHSEIVKTQNFPTLETGALDGFYRQSGDQVEVEIISNEDLDYSSIRNKYEKFEYGIFPQNVDAKKTNGYFQIEGYAVEGKYTVGLVLSDRAGNKTEQTVNYIVDNTKPDLPEQDKTLWGQITGFDRRNLPAANSFPADNRLLQISIGKNYVLKEDTISLFGLAEINTYPILIVDNQEVKAVRPSEQCDIAKNREEKKATDGTIVKANMYCLWQFEYKFPSEKSYRIQYRTEDKSGNRSEITYQYLIEHDKTAPKFFEINNASSNRFNPLIDWRQNGERTFYNDGRGYLNPVTNQLDLKLSGQTEQLADVEYILVSPTGQPLDYKKLINNFNQKHEVNLQLGNQRGASQDGIYTIAYRSGDSADNETELKVFQIERDTVTPAPPRVAAGMSSLYTIAASVSGEPYTNSSLFGNLGRQGGKSGTVKTLNVNNDADWEATFTFCSNLADRATNTSESRCASVTTPVRPPREGECSVESNTSLQAKFKEYVEKGEVPDVGNLGYSKSCLTYIPKDKLLGQYKDYKAKVEFEKAAKSALKCRYENAGNEEIGDVDEYCKTREYYSKDKIDQLKKEDQFNACVQKYNPKKVEGSGTTQILINTNEYVVNGYKPGIKDCATQYQISLTFDEIDNLDKRLKNNDSFRSCLKDLKSNDPKEIKDCGDKYGLELKDGQINKISDQLETKLQYDCITGNLEHYDKNKGSNSKTKDLTDQTIKNCSISKDLLDKKIDGDKTLREAIQEGYKSIQDKHGRGETGGSLCFEIFIGNKECWKEFRYEASEGFGALATIITLPTNLIITGLQTNFNDKSYLENLQSNLNFVYDAGKNISIGAMNFIGNLPFAIIDSVKVLADPNATWEQKLVQGVGGLVTSISGIVGFVFPPAWIITGLVGGATGLASMFMDENGHFTGSLENVGDNLLLAACGSGATATKDENGNRDVEVTNGWQCLGNAGAALGVSALTGKMAKDRLNAWRISNKIDAPNIGIADDLDNPAHNSKLYDLYKKELALKERLGSTFDDQFKNLKGVDYENALNDAFDNYMSNPNTRKIVNSNYAGKKISTEQLFNDKPGFKNKYPNLARDYPEGVYYNPDGTPDFRPYGKEVYTMKNNKFSYKSNGDLDYYEDFKEVNSWYQNKYGKSIPDNTTWHHHFDKKTLILVPKDLHDAFRHTGFLY